MKFLILVALFAFASADIRKSTIYDRSCSERSNEIRPQVKTAFNVAAVSIQMLKLRQVDHYFLYPAVFRNLV